MVDEDWDTAVRVEAQKPVFLLLVGHDVAGERERKSVSYLNGSSIGRWVSGLGWDVHEGLCPLSAVDIMQLLKHNLHLLPIGGALGNKVETLNNAFSTRSTTM